MERPMGNARANLDTLWNEANKKAMGATPGWPGHALTFGCCGLDGKRCNCGGRSGM